MRSAVHSIADTKMGSSKVCSSGADEEKQRRQLTCAISLRRSRKPPGALSVASSLSKLLVHYSDTGGISR
eukprot:6218876-Prymnesium_polylepis.1